MTAIEPLVASFYEVTKELKEQSIKIAIEQDRMTPSRGFIAETTKYLHEKKRSLDVLISANKNSDAFNDSEIKIMEDDLFQCQELGVDGVFIGALTLGKELDEEAMETIVAAAGGMELYFSLAFDKIAEKNWDYSLKWLDQNDFSGIVASSRLASLKKKLTSYPNLKLIPYTTTAAETKQVEKEISPLIILNKK